MNLLRSSGRALLGGIVAGGAAPVVYPPSLMGTLGDMFQVHGAFQNNGNSQGIGVDNVNRWLYNIYEQSSTSYITRFDLDGARSQVATSETAASTDIGHSAVTVEQATGKLWSLGRATAKSCIRYDFPASNGGAITNVQYYTFFADQTGSATYDYAHPVCPANNGNTFFFVAYALVGGTVMVRKYLIADLIAGGAGDYSAGGANAGLIQAQWIVPSFTVSDGGFPLQAVAANATSITFVAGFGNVLGVANNFKVTTTDYAGTLLDSTTTASSSGRPWSLSDVGGDTSVEHWEPEGFAYALFGGTYVPLFCSFSGTTKTWNRVWKVGATVTPDPEAIVARWEAAVVALTGSVTSGMRAAVKTLITSAISNGWYGYMGNLHLLRSESRIQSRVGIFDPAHSVLTENSTISAGFTAKAGWAGQSSATIYLNIAAPTVQGALQNYGQNQAMLGCYTTATAAEATGGFVIRTSGTTLTGLQTRNASDQCATLMNDQTAAGAGTLTSGVTDGSGLWLLNRRLSTGYDVDRNGSTLASPATASVNFTSVTMQFLRSCANQYQAVFWGYPMSTTLQALMKTDLETALTTIAAL